MVGRWIDVGEDKVVEESESVGEMFIEMGGCSIEVRVEDGCYFRVVV